MVHGALARTFVWWYEKALLNTELTPAVTSWMRPGSVVGKMERWTTSPSSSSSSAPAACSSSMARTPCRPPTMDVHRFNKEAVKKMVADQRVVDGAFLDKNDQMNCLDKPESPCREVTVPVSQGTEWWPSATYYWKITTRRTNCRISTNRLPRGRNVEVLVSGPDGEIDNVRPAHPAPRSPSF